MKTHNPIIENKSSVKHFIVGLVFGIFIPSVLFVFFQYFSLIWFLLPVALYQTVLKGRKSRFDFYISAVLFIIVVSAGLAG